MKLEFSRKILKNTHVTNYMKIRAVGAELLCAEGRADMRTERGTDGRET